MQVKCHLLDILPLRLWEICKYHTSHCICLVLISCIKTWYKQKHFRTFVRCFSSCSRFLTSDLRFSFLFDSALCTFASAFCCSLSSISSFFSIPPASYKAHHEQMKTLIQQLYNKIQSSSSSSSSSNFPLLEQDPPLLQMQVDLQKQCYAIWAK